MKFLIKLLGLSDTNDRESIERQITKLIRTINKTTDPITVKNLEDQRARLQRELDRMPQF